MQKTLFKYCYLYVDSHLWSYTNISICLHTSLRVSSYIYMNAHISMYLHFYALICVRTISLWLIVEPHVCVLLWNTFGKSKRTILLNWRLHFKLCLFVSLMILHSQLRKSFLGAYQRARGSIFEIFNWGLLKWIYLHLCLGFIKL